MALIRRLEDVSVIDWLLDSDPSIRWQVMRDLTDAPANVASERAKVGTEGWGAELLARQAQDGQSGGDPPSPSGPPAPEWHAIVTLAWLRDLRLDPKSAEVRAPARFALTGSRCGAGIERARGRLRAFPPRLIEASADPDYTREASRERGDDHDGQDRRPQQDRQCRRTKADDARVEHELIACAQRGRGHQSSEQGGCQHGNHMLNALRQGPSAQQDGPCGLDDHRADADSQDNDPGIAHRFTSPMSAAAKGTAVLAPRRSSNRIGGGEVMEVGC
jgi:hypothetical protein